MAAPDPIHQPTLLCAVGMLLLVAEVPAFGFDLADDALGFALVAIGAWQHRSGGRWWRATAGLAGLGVLTDLFTYGGVVSRFLEVGYLFWDWTLYGSIAVTGLVVALLAMALRSDIGSAAPAPWLLLVAIGIAAATGLHLLLVAGRVNMYGPMSFAPQLTSLTIGGLTLLLVVLSFLGVRQGRR